MLLPARCHRGRGPPKHMSVWFDTGLSSQPTFVPPTKMPPRAPLGPSLVFTAGMFLEGIAFVLQKSAAVSKEICCHVSHHL
jgi:hypothetical protein